MSIPVPSFDSFPSFDPGPSSKPTEPKHSERDSKPNKSRKEEGSRRRDGEREPERERDRKRDQRDRKPSRERTDAHHSRSSRDKSHKSSRDEKDRRRSSKRDGSSRHVEDERDSHRDKRRKDDRYAEPSTTASSLFVTDVRGDKLNMTYGSIHAATIPRLRRATRHVLGTPAAFRIISDSNKGVEVGLFGRRPGTRYTDRHAAAVLRSTDVRHIVKPMDRPFRGEHEDGSFIPMSNRTSAPNRDQSSVFRELLLDGEAKSSSSDSSDSDNEPDDDEADTVTGLSADQESMKLLEAKLADDPSSLASWHAVLSHSLATIPPDSRNARKARGEITLSVFGRALTASESNGTSARLRALYLQAGESVWSADKLEAEWDSALRTVKNKAQIYLAWLNWRLQVRMRQGDLTGVADDVGRAFRALESQESEITRVGILLRCARFFKEAGYPERGVALFQAQVELAYFTPEMLRDNPLSTQRSILEQFWDAEVPRIGEKGAMGWATWMTLPLDPDFRPNDPQSTTAPAANSDDANADLYSRWYANEVRLDAQRTRPLRTTDDSDDPYATVLFSDVRDFLSPIRSDEGRWFLLHTFLSYLGLHIPDLAASFDHLTSAGSDDDLAHPSDGWILPYSQNFVARLFPDGRLKVSEDWEVVAGAVVAKEDTSERTKAAFGMVKEWPWKAIHPLAGTGSKGAGRLWEAVDVEGLDHGFIGNVFSQMSAVLEDDDDWDTLHVAFEAAISARSAVKLSKSLLSRRPSSLPLWITHARLEQLRGKTGDARTVYKANLVDAKQPADKVGLAEMWWHWAELEWLSNDAARANEAIHASCGQSSTGGIGLLKTKRALDDRLATSGPDRRHWVCLRALLELLTTSSPAAALTIFARVDDAEDQAPLDVASTLMVYHHLHTLRNACPPVVLRDHAEAALARNPENSIVLGVFLESQRGQWSLNKAQKLHAVVRDGTRPRRLVRVVWDIWNAGRERGEYAYQRLRQSLGSAVNQPGVSPLLWRLFLALEIHAGNTAQAKSTMLRGTGDCPWSKDLYLPAFGPLRQAYKPSELNRWGELMVERGIRLRQEMDVFTAAHEDDTRDEELPAIEPDIEYNASELRRLMPY